MDMQQASPSSSAVAYDELPLSVKASNSPQSPSTTSTTATQSIEAAKDIAFGSFAGSIGKVVEYPFDTVKVRLQSQPDHLPLRYTGPLDCFRQSVRADGVRGLYRGISAPLFGAAAETACLFFSYRVAQDAMKEAGLLRAGKDGDLPLGGLVAAGAISGGVTSVILTPIELVKCRMQVPMDISPVDPTLGRVRPTSATISPLTVMAQVYRSEGLKGFWRGQLGTLIREMGGSAAWFGTYETLSLYFKRKQAAQASSAKAQQASTSLPIHQQMLSGAAAGMMYNFLFFPADTIKSKMQTGDLGPAVGSKRRVTFWNVSTELWKVHGLKGLYRGCGITVVRSAPSSALIFTIYEGLREAFG
ncbi:mitochondrial carrier [Polychaeton citri CBS 116435]|uniref:Mitochondrial carrier n=1 Tax=Polychaeton citri CBS 116435 TaxID=1314669 RepID=A0A9P4PWS5_9PEZI|nr:mitochondrial carrier [Polychaeton citri CBS 116435]